MKVGQILALVRNPKGDIYERKPTKVILVDLVAPGSDASAEARMLTIMQRFAKVFDGILDDYPRVYAKHEPGMRGPRMIEAKFRDEDVEVSVDAMEKILDRLEAK